MVKAMMKNIKTNQQNPEEDNMAPLSSFRCCYSPSPSNQIKVAYGTASVRSPPNFLFISTKCLGQMAGILLYILAKLFKLK